VWVCVYAHTHAHCTYGVLGCEPRGLDETPAGPEESRWTKSRHICIRIRVQNTYAYATRRDGILYELFFSEKYFFFRKRKAKDVSTIH